MMETVDDDHDAIRDPNGISDVLIVSLIALSIAFFVIANEALRSLSGRCQLLAKTSEWWWRNLTVSWLHADLCALGCISCYLAYGHHVQSLSDLLDLQPIGAYILVAFSTGYFTYDMLDHWREGQLLVQWEVISHHVAVIYIFLYNLLCHFCVSFSVLALMVEINSVFLHGRKLLQMIAMPFNHWFYRTMAVLNLVTFVVFRGVPLALIWAGLLYNGHRYSTTYFVSLASVMVFMVVLNPILFWRLLKSDLLRKHRKTSNGTQKQREANKRQNQSIENGGHSGKEVFLNGNDGSVSQRNVHSLWNGP